MGFYDDLLRQKSSSSSISDRVYERDISSVTESVFNALDIKPGKWKPLNLSEGDIVMGQERIHGTRHMIRMRGQARGHYIIDCGGTDIIIEVNAYARDDGTVSIEMAGVRRDLCKSDADFLEKVKASITWRFQQASS